VSRTVDDARALAAAAHRGQVDKAGRPYIEHPAAVAAALEPHGELALMAGWLHDVVEDCGVTLGQLAGMGFPPAVVAAVDSVTHRQGETYLDGVRRAAADPIGRLVKLADNAHNSDEGRLGLLDEATAVRLRKKYARARKILEDQAWATS
jgi:(p)ppGpp synthase/HD superfamily hydrolase